MQVKIKRLSPDAVIPHKAHKSDAGFDIHCTSTLIDWGKQELICKTGLAFEIPDGYAGFLFPRSSIANKPLMLTNAVGVIDSGFNGEVTAKFLITDARAYLQDTDNQYHAGDRIAQMVILPYPEIEFEETDTLSETERGTGGYGSTGR